MLSVVRLLFIVVPFAFRTRGVFPGVLEFVREVRKSLPEGGRRLGVAGFCWGGMHAVGLCREGREQGKGGGERLVDACFVAHPAGLKPGQFVGS